MGEDVRTWHEIVESQRGVCPCCGAKPIIEVKNDNDKKDVWGPPYEGEQDDEGKLWRILCPSCGLRMYDTNWSYLFLKWDRRYINEKTKTAIDKACGQLEFWIPEIKKLKTKVEVLEHRG